MRRIRIVLFALLALAAAPAHAQPPAPTTGAAASPVTGAPAPAASASAASPAAGVQRATPPRTLRAYTHVFAAFAIAWVLLFGYLVFIARKFRRVEEQVEALARA
jgi:CcmD family protein